MKIPALIGIALWALIPGFIAKKKYRSFWGYYFLSFLISPLITMIIALCVSDKICEHYAKNPPPSYHGPDQQEVFPITPSFSNSPVASKEPNTTWICEKCKTKNLGTRNTCWSCGSPK